MTIMVTGAWGYCGARIAREILARQDLRPDAHTDLWSLTTRGPRPSGAMPDGSRDPWEGRIDARRPDRADQDESRWDPDELHRLFTERPTDVVVSTYWSRHDDPPPGHQGTWTGHDTAAANSITLIEAALDAGVKAFVFTSVTNPGQATDLSFFSGKLQVENAVRLGFHARSWAVLRPGAFFGQGGPPNRPSHRGVLLETIGWACRRSPVIPLPPGRCPVRPIHVDDYAKLVSGIVQRVRDGQPVHETRDACGADEYSLRELVALTGRHMGRRPIVIQGRSDRWCRLAADAVRWWTGQPLASQDEITAVSRGLYDSNEEPPATSTEDCGHTGTRLRAWLADHARKLGTARIDDHGA